jgi:hypothetical protein
MTDIVLSSLPTNNILNCLSPYNDATAGSTASAHTDFADGKELMSVDMWHESGDGRRDGHEQIFTRLPNKTEHRGRVIIISALYS